MKEAPEEQVVAGRIARDAVKLGRELTATAIDGVRLDRTIEEFIRDQGGEPALKDYRPTFSLQPYEWTICLALDNDAVHGTPMRLVGPKKLITIDLVVRYKGWHADTARTFTISDDPLRRQFARNSLLIFDAALETIQPMQPISTFGMVVDNAARMQGYSVVREFCGHGIGTSIHAEPQILNYPAPTQERFQVGQSYAVEPVLAEQGTYSLRKANDGWTVTADCLVSHNEDTVFVGSDGIVNLTGDE